MKCELCGRFSDEPQTIAEGTCPTCNAFAQEQPAYYKLYSERIKQLLYQLDGVKIVVKDHSDKQKVSHCVDTPAQEVRGVLHEYHDVTTRALQTAKEFRDRMMVDVRAWELVLHMVMNASTHKEKDSRLRGCLELMSHAVEKLKREEFDLAICKRPSFEECFSSDYPTRHFVDRIHELERQIEELKNPKDNERQKP